MGFHTAKEIPNYWTYAKQYLLQDRMFAPADSWTLPSHLYLVSAWSATCTDLHRWQSCRSDLDEPGGIWADAGHDLDPAHGRASARTSGPTSRGCSTRAVSTGRTTWGPARASRLRATTHRGTMTAPVQNPLPGFPAVAQNGKLENVRDNTEFFDAAADGTLPSVSLGHAHYRTAASTRLTTSGTGRRGSPSW